MKLDVWAKAVDDVVYDTEVQKRNTKDLPKRSRLYNSLIDSNLLPPGTTSYKPLNDVYVIMIMPFDLFGKGLYRYTFNMKCQEVPDLRLEDGATRIFLNTRGTDPEGVSDELIDLLKYGEHSTDEAAERARLEKERLKEKSIADAELGGGVVNVKGLQINTKIKDTLSVSFRDLLGFAGRKERKEASEEKTQEMRE